MGAPLVSPIGEPLELSDGRCLTFWPQIDTSAQASIEQLTKTIADCHALMPIPGMRHWQPSFNNQQVVSRLARGQQAGVPKAVIDKLATAWSKILQGLTSYWKYTDQQAKQPRVLHGDPQPNNTGRLGRKVVSD